MATAKGDLQSEPLACLLQRALVERITGRLALAGAPGPAILYLRDGYPVFVSGPEATARLGQVLVELTLLDARTLEALLRVQASSKRRLGDLLVEIGRVDLQGLGRGLRQQLFINGARLFARRSGPYELELCEHVRGLDPPGRAARVHPHRLLYEGLRTSWSEADLRAFLAPLTAKAIRLQPDASTAVEIFGFSPEDRQAADLLAKGYWSLDDLASGCDAGPASALLVAASLWAGGTIENQPKDAVPRLRRRARPAVSPPSPPSMPSNPATPSKSSQSPLARTVPPTLPSIPAARPPSTLSTPSVPSIAAARGGTSASSLEDQVRAKVALLEQTDHYGLLEVPRDASRAAIKNAYFTLAKVYHPDRALSVGLPALRPELERLFARIAEAYATLSDDGKRAEYDTRATGARSGSGDDEQRARRALEAEIEFQKGEVLFRRKDFPGALASLQSAVEKSPEEGEHLALWAWVEYVRPGSEAGPAVTLERLRKAITLSPRCARAHQYLGMLLKTEGDLAGAVQAFKRAVELQPHLGEAQSELRVLQMRLERGGSKKSNSLLERILKK